MVELTPSRRKKSPLNDSEKDRIARALAFSKSRPPRMHLDEALSVSGVLIPDKCNSSAQTDLKIVGDVPANEISNATEDADEEATNTVKADAGPQT